MSEQVKNVTRLGPGGQFEKSIDVFAQANKGRAWLIISQNPVSLRFECCSSVDHETTKTMVDMFRPSLAAVDAQNQ